MSKRANVVSQIPIFILSPDLNEYFLNILKNGIASALV